MDEHEWAACGDPEKMLALLGDRATQRKVHLYRCACLRRLWSKLSSVVRAHIMLDEDHAESAVGPASQLDLIAASLPFLGVRNDLLHLVHSQDERRIRPALLRDIFGPLPFRPRPPLEWPVRAWNDGIIVKLATSIYDERKLPEGTLDRDRLAVLGDAMEEAGVTDQDMLGHLRLQGAVHVRGCFVVDWLLGKE
jgi:hypothetical protein